MSKIKKHQKYVDAIVLVILKRQCPGCHEKYNSLIIIYKGIQ